ncbi:MAG: hypothetical protein V1690_02700 [Candidatus Moraniibacteriota bacterium]
MKKDNITSQIDYFLDVVEREAKEKKSTKQTIFKIETSELAGQMALWYEKVRTAVQYKEEHLLRRTAIYRILKRLIIFEQRRRKKATTFAFFLELAMAGYVQQNDANDDNFRETQRIISRYLVALECASKSIGNPAESLEIRRWFINLASEEIENLINPQKEKMALIYSIYETLRPKIRFSLEKMPYPLSGSRVAGFQSVAEEYLGVGSLVEPFEDRFIRNLSKNQTDSEKAQMEKLLNMLTYLSIFRNLRRSDRAMLRALIFNIYFPQWVKFSAEDTAEIEKTVRGFIKKRKEIEIVAEHPLVGRILYPIKKYMLSASFLYEAAMDNPREARAIVSQDFLLHEKVREQCNIRYAREKKKLRKRIFRGFLYVFLTKMLVALILEVPYEALKSTAIQYKPLLINLLFPPVLLTAIASSAKYPTNENTKEIIKNVELLIYQGKQEEDLKNIRITDRESAVAERFLDLFYVILFVGALVTLIKILAFMEFNLVAMVIFVIFAGTVSFFGALIRQSIRDLVVTKDREGLFSLIFDTILLPFVRLGRLLSVKFSRINVFIFILDFLIEAPFKFIIRAFEAWINFLRRKRDEIERQFD